MAGNRLGCTHPHWKKWSGRQVGEGIGESCTPKNDFLILVKSFAISQSDKLTLCSIMGYYDHTDRHESAAPNFF